MADFDESSNEPWREPLFVERKRGQKSKKVLAASKVQLDSPAHKNHVETETHSLQSVKPLSHSEMSLLCFPRRKFPREKNIPIGNGITDQRPHISCEICPETFFDKRSMKRHLQIHTRAKPYSCELCSKNFTGNRSLAAHQRIHTREKPYACELCPQMFAESGNLKCHLQIHAGESPIPANCALRNSRDLNI